jgi:putative colanic acid biosynthesis acetyltransferase WcaF
MNSEPVDVVANRAVRKWSLSVQVMRVLWAFSGPLFRLSLRPMWGWRRGLLRLFGARIGIQAHICPSARITMPWNIEIGPFAALGDHTIIYALGKIVIGSRATISQGAHLCAGTHDIGDPTRPLLTPPITIGTDAWICADAFVGPDVVVGEGAIVGARAVAMKDVPPYAIVVGNPARQIGTTKR